MPQYPRRRRAWDWMTPAEIKHLPVDEREALMKEAAATATRDQLYRFIQYGGIAILLISSAGMIFVQDAPISYRWMLSALSASLMALYFILASVGLFRYRRRVRQYLREQLFARHICPACCFECGAFTEGYEGTECPVCGVPLV